MNGIGPAEMILVVVLSILGILAIGGKKTTGPVFLFVGIALIVLSIRNFVEIPFSGAVFMFPGGNVNDAVVVDPLIKTIVLLAGIAIAIFGTYLFIKRSIGNNKINLIFQNANKDNSARDNLNKIKEAKDLLGSGAINQDEFVKLKSKYLEK